ncbi:MAG TPA: hypothetical protein VFS08_21270 [Gemmatimonadaceae bacterium]|nr:hypothetical protein [Gemmatimonadaceae bacterium]
MRAERGRRAAASRRALHPAVQAWLHEALRDADAACALSFAEAVVMQVAQPLGAVPERQAVDAAQPSIRESTVAEAVVALARVAPGPPSPAVAGLHADAAFLAACFQNMDLLPAHGCPAGDRIARRVADAIAHLPHHDAPDAL